MIIRTLFNKGSRVPLRGKVNEAVTTGVRVVDTILPIGRGQRREIHGELFLDEVQSMSSWTLRLCKWLKQLDSKLSPVKGFMCGKVYVDYRIKRHTPLPVLYISTITEIPPGSIVNSMIFIQIKV